MMVKIFSPTVIEIITSKAFGYARRFDITGSDLSDPEKMSTEHLFDIASLTKVVGTTTAIMLLADRNKLTIDDRVGKYIPAFQEGDKSTITIRHLLTHSSGMYEWYPMYYKARTLEESWKLIGSLPLKLPVGKQRKYSDLGFTILAQIIQILSKHSFESFLEEEVFRPLQMNNTFYNPKGTAKSPCKILGYGDKIAPTNSFRALWIRR